MPHILNLANEILYHIIAATNPHDIESLAASCKKIHSLAESKVKHHRELKKKYASLAFRDCGKLQNDPGVHPIYVLRDILHDTTLAQYPTFIRSAPFDNDYYEWLNTVHDRADLEGIRAVAAGCDREIHHAIYQCPFIEPRERETWRAQIMAGRREAIFRLLITLLPHLTSIAVVQQPKSLFAQMVQRIVEFQQPTHKLEPRALERSSFSFSDRMATRVVYQPRKIIRGLELYTKCSLSYLHLTGTRIRINTTQDDDLDDDLEYDLRGFEMLKQLRIDHTLLSHHDRPWVSSIQRKVRPGYYSV